MVAFDNDFTVDPAVMDKILDAKTKVFDVNKGSVDQDDDDLDDLDDLGPVEPDEPDNGYEDDEDEPPAAAVLVAFDKLQKTLEEMRDDISSINSNISMIDTRMHKHEELTKNSEKLGAGKNDDHEYSELNVKIARIVEACNSLNELKDRLTKDMSIFNRENMKAVFDNIDVKLRAIHQENMSRKDDLEEIADNLGGTLIKWAFVYSALFSCLCAIIIAICMIFMK